MDIEKKKKMKKKKKVKKTGEAAAGTEAPVEDADTGSGSKVDSPIRPGGQTAENARAERVNLGTANKACMGRSLNSILSNMGKEKAQEHFQALRANSRESPMTKTKHYTMGN